LLILGLAVPCVADVPTESGSAAPTLPNLTFDFRSTDVGDALRAIAATHKLSIVVDPLVTGRVTVRLLNIPFEPALRSLLDQVGATYRFEDGIYKVSKRPSAASSALISVKEGRLTLDVINIEIRQVLSGIATQAGINIVPASGVQGLVTQRLSDVPVELGLETLCSSMGLLAMRQPGGREGVPPIYRVITNQAQQGSSGQVYAQVQQGLLTVDVTAADLAELIKAITRQTGDDVVLFGQVKESVTARFTKRPLEEAMRVIFSGSKYTYKKDGNLLLVGDPSAGAAESKALNAMELVFLNHIKAEDALALLPASFAQLQVKVVKEQNALAVLAPQKAIGEMKGYLDQIDRQAPQVMIECVVVEFSKNAGKDFGLSGAVGARQIIDFAALSGGKLKDDKDHAYAEVETFPPFSLAVGSVGALPAGFSVRLNAAIQEGKAKVRANPKIATISGHRATINVGSVSYFQVTGAPQQQLGSGQQTTIITQYPQSTIQSIQAGITLDITPWVSASGEITTDLAPEVSSSVGTGPQGLPQLRQRKVSTTLKVKDGETIVIGGLIQTTDSSSVDKVPLLGDIPILGALFRHETKQEEESELEIYITPHLLGTLVTSNQRRSTAGDQNSELVDKQERQREDQP